MASRKEYSGQKAKISSFLKSHKFDIVFLLFLMLISLRYYDYISKMAVPGWDGAVYLQNARDWLAGSALYEVYRPPLISLLIAGIWSVSGENWMLVKPVNALFTIGAGVMLYIIVRRHKGGLFALLVAALTMLNPTLFFNGTQIYTHAMALFFLLLALFFLESEKPERWFLAGISIGLVFASRYPVILEAVAVLFAVSLIRKNRRIFTTAVKSALIVVAMVVLLVYAKTGTFQTAIEEDTNFSILLSPYYLLNSINIWGPAFLLVPLALFSRKTWADKANYAFVSWFAASFVFWSANLGNQQFRFAIEFTPAVYYLAILAAEGMFKSSLTFENAALAAKADIAGFFGKLKTGAGSLIPRGPGKTKVSFALIILFWAALFAWAPFHLKPLADAVLYPNIAVPAGAAPITGYFSYKDAGASHNNNTNISCRVDFPTERSIILRLDDVQALAWSKIVANLTDTILGRNMSVTLAVIPKGLAENGESDSLTRTYLISKRSDTRVEVAMHGVNHETFEFSNLSENGTYELAKEGLEELVRALNIYPVTFIPPNNEYSTNTTKALSRLGFKIFSAKNDEYKFDGNMLLVGYTTATKDSDQKELFPVSRVVSQCSDSLNLKNICVIMSHPEDYVNGDRRTMNATRYNEFLKLLDSLEKLNATFTTFGHMVKCE